MNDFYIYKNKKTGKYYRILQTDSDNIEKSDKFASDICALWGYETLFYKEELKQIRKEKLLKLEKS
jgi:hypothetical protein